VKQKGKSRISDQAKGRKKEEPSFSVGKKKGGKASAVAIILRLV